MRTTSWSERKGFAMANGSDDPGWSTKVKGYGTAAGVFVGLLTAVFAFGAEVIDRWGPNESRPQTSGEESGQNSEDTPQIYESYALRGNDTGALSVEVPAAWNHIDPTLCFAMGNADCLGPQLEASTNMAEWVNGKYTVPGLWFAATDDAAILKLGIAGMLDRGRGLYAGSCSDLAGRDKFQQGAYTAQRDTYKGCGPKNAEVWAIWLKPKDKSVMVLLEITILNEADYGAAKRILDTFQVDEDKLRGRGDVSLP